jgi:ribosome-associated protein
VQIMLQITPTFSLADNELEERFVRASGPGGQNVNKVATAVELRFSVRASSLPEEVKARLAVLAGRRMNADGVVLIDSREHRTQAGNREAARARLAVLLRQAFRRPRARKATKPTKASRERRLDAKEQRARVKVHRGRVRGEET